MAYTEEDARAYAKANIARICAEQGVTVKIQDPALVAYTVEMLRIGKRQREALDT